MKRLLYAMIFLPLLLIPIVGMGLTTVIRDELKSQVPEEYWGTYATERETGGIHV